MRYITLLFLSTLLSLLLVKSANSQDINNDACNAIILNINENCTGFQYSTEFATSEASEPNCSGDLNTVWFKFIAPASELIKVSIKRETIRQPRIGVYTITDCADLSTASLVNCSSSNPSPITNVIANETYYIQVDAALDMGTFCIIVESCDPPPNDNACDAVSLTVNDNCTGFEYTTKFATAETSEPNCAFAEKNTVWFKFTAPASELIKILIKEETIVSPRIGIYTITDCADLSTASLVDCSSSNPSAITSVIANETYYIQVDAALDMGTFCIIVESCDPPPNDNACDAVSLTVNDNCTGFEYTTKFATAEASEPNCAFAEKNTVWFKFVAPASQMISVTIKRETIVAPRIGVYTITDCADLSTASLVDCFTSSPSPNFSVIPNETYYIQVDAALEMGTFCILVTEINSTVTTPCPNDLVCNAIVLTLDASCSFYSNECATSETSEPEGSCFLGSDLNSIWFQFTAPSSGRVNVIQSGFLSEQWAIYEIPSCTNLLTATEFFCSLNGEDFVDGLTGGTTYYIQLDGTLANIGESCLRVESCDIIPSNDLACNAIVLSLDASCTFYSNECATSQASETEGSCFLGNDLNSIWFQFTAPSSGRVNVIQSSFFSQQWSIYNVPDCNNLSTATEIFCSRNAEDFVDGLTGGALYYIQLDGTIDDVGESCIRVESCDIIPSNDLACNAIVLTLDAPCAFYSNECTTSQASETEGSCFLGNDLNSIWFQFTAPPSGRVNVIQSSFFSQQWSIYNVSDCNNLTTATEVFCSRNAEDFVDGLTNGALYYIQVDATFDDVGESCIRVESCDIIPPNDLACNAIVLTLDAPCTFYSNECATSQASETEGSCFLGNDLNSIWFKFTAPSSGQVNVIQSSFFSQQWSIYNVTNCNNLTTATEIFCSRSDEELVVGLTGGSEYYIQLDATFDDVGESCLRIEDPDNPCTQPSQRYLSGTTGDTILYQAKSSISSVQQISSLGNIQYNAENHIILLPGFNALGELLMIIDDCDN
ncbi:hypothetical protein N9L92_00775 [Saprospiraceae bacterium]|nr:hypothetical protein [Saprospiraceae bacterium]